jgi:hypothetical protein
MVEHAVDVRREIVINADADVVWDVVADAERQAEWFPGMVSSLVIDGTRTIVTAVGGMLIEEILTVDHQARCFEYSITGPVHLDHHRGRITVMEAPGGARVVYEQELEPKALVYVLDAAIGDALDGLRDLVMDGRTSRSFAAPDAVPGGRPTEEGA